MRCPRFVSPGGRIGVTAPSYSVSAVKDGVRFSNAVRHFGERGYQVVMTPDVFLYGEEEDRAPAEIRAREVEDLFRDDSVDAIIAASGGDYEHEILELIDWDLLEKNPKWVQGYSDNTSLLLKYTVEHDVPTIYCGNFGDFGMGIWHRSISENLEFLEGKLTEQRSFSFYQDGFRDRDTPLDGFSFDRRTDLTCTDGDCVFSGILLGGCMDILEMFVNDDSLDVKGFSERNPGNVIWYMETFAMDEGRIRSALRRMAERGWFDNVSGFVFGRELFYEGTPYSEVVADALSEFDVPKVFGADVGHKAPRMVFANGLRARFDIRSGGCTVRYEKE